MVTEERVLQFELTLGQSDALNSHVDHEFEIREKPNKRGECKGKFGLGITRKLQVNLVCYGALRL
jgi:hypothetical protein